MNGTSMEGLGYQQWWDRMYLGTMGGVGEEPEEVGKVSGLLEKLETEGCPLKNSSGSSVHNDRES